ncbi:MAG: hypothetical protein KKB81_02810 [Candidatus Margulisbacteria bacterium]|nr:hypothetical protein [Candidatus Margulisiibacteriota bacterium]MBU1022182.1 hypothetical protein [Candidatus Margulisiibacteriota bacterium]MBU1729379.1 hypothetical protein [Candidatus Margulisiibacteriota bacterium]MBU1955652.1 hypothetical protein [Candidatus Margulisiibacteriota bacterium]
MTHEEKSDYCKWLIINEIKEELVCQDELLSRVTFEVKPSLGISLHRQRQALYKLGREGAFFIKPDACPGMVEEQVFRYWATINQPKFDELYKSYKHKAAKIEKKRIPKLPINPVIVPNGTKWDAITIKFIDGHTIKITGKNVNETRNYKEMGFEDRKSLLPNIQWEMLGQLAENNGEISWEKPHLGKKTNLRKIAQDFSNDFDDANNEAQNRGFGIIKVPDQNKARKKQLSKTLKKAIIQMDGNQIEGDPFFSYKQVKAYKTRFTLISDK